jgi:uncharacterized protein YidB (DUF937 family)
MSKQTSHEFSTKLNKDEKESTKTKMVLTWDITEEEIYKLAARAVIIEQQAIYRISGTIPSSDESTVSSILAAKKGMSKPMTAEQLKTKTLENPEVLRAVMEGLGMSEKQIADTIAKKFPK